MASKKTISQMGGEARAQSLTPAQRTAIAREAAAARWGGLREAHTGMANLVGFQIPCAVLDNKMRVFTRTGVSETFGSAKKTANAPNPGGAPQPPGFLGAANLRPYYSPELQDKLSHPIAYRSIDGRTNFGYECSILADICEAVIEAERAGVLKPNQAKVAEAARALYKGLVRTAVVAIIDEATGYDKLRDREELHRILAAYIAPELLPWTKRFPDEFYKQMFRLWGWPYSPPQIKRPQIVGRITNQLVYDRLPPGVRAELEAKNPTNERGWRRHKHHQLLSKDVGNKHLEDHIREVVVLMRGARNREQFEEVFNRAFPSSAGQLGLGFDEDE